MKFKRMSTISFDQKLNLQIPNKSHHKRGPITEEIEGLIQVYADGHIERPPIIPNVPCNPIASDKNVTSKDVLIDKFTNTWGRIYVASSQSNLPLIVYFHGGGFCVGSAAWSCYHEFLTNLSSKSKCIILSVNYRLSPENRLPAPYDDGLKTLMWIKQQALNDPVEQKWWLRHCNLSKLFLAGDSAGANIAYNIAAKLNEPTILKPLNVKGMILIQPFFGGEERTKSEKQSITTQPFNSALTLHASDTYWRLSLPAGTNRDHQWSNPLAKLRDLKLPPSLVLISDMDILRDRNLEFCSAMAASKKKVETVIFKGVGHGFQVLDKSQLSIMRIQEMITSIQFFVHQ